MLHMLKILQLSKYVSKKRRYRKNAIHLGFLKGRFRAAHYSGDYGDEGIIPTSYRHDLTKYT